MKTIAFFLVLALCCLGVNAQKPVTVTEDTLKFAKSTLPALTVTIPEVGYEKVLKSWTRELQSGTKSKLVTENNEMTIFGAKIKDLSPDPINVYSKMSNLDSLVKLTVAFEPKKDRYIDRSNGETELTKAKKYLKDFAKNEYLDIAKDQANAEDKKLKDLQKELASLQREKSKLQKSIQSDSTDIFNANENIKINKNELETASAALVEQNGQMAPETDAEKKERSSQMNTLEKRKKKAENEVESSQNKINKLENNIEKARTEIPRNERQQQDLNDKIEAQQKVANKFADKVDRIKSY